MQDQVNLETIQDVAELNALYVQCNENLSQAQQAVQVQSQNLGVIRARLQQIQDKPEDVAAESK